MRRYTEDLKAEIRAWGEEHDEDPAGMSADRYIRGIDVMRRPNAKTTRGEFLIEKQVRQLDRIIEQLERMNGVLERMAARS